MPLDAITVSALEKELKKALGGKIDKVQQPAKDMLLISLRTAGENLKLLISVGTGSARVHFTKNNFDNPAQPPMFCMLLRKYLIGAKISAVEQPNMERMIIFTLDTHNELGVPSQKTLAVELIGRSANVVLTDGDGRIIDCMRRMDFAGDATRCLQPGMIYRLPPQQAKVPFLAAGSDGRREVLKTYDGQCAGDKFLLNSFAGLSPLICRELWYRSGERAENLPPVCDALADMVQAGEYSPTLIKIDGKAADFSFMSVSQYGQRASLETYDSVSTLLDEFYTARDRAEQQRRRGRELYKSVKTVRDRIQRKLSLQYEEYKRTDDRETIRKQAELITANIYRMKKGERELRCEDYYEENSPQITIPLDPLKTPQQNAAAYYKEYNKLKAAREHLDVLIKQGENQLEYLNSVIDEIDRADGERDLSEIRRELTDTGYIKKSKNAKNQKIKPQAPLRLVTDEGLEILVGRNNVQNDELTCKIARRTDYWFHTQKVHGSHVILRCDGLEPDENSVRQAAAVAAYYSQGRDGGKIPVDYTMVRNVRKSAGALPGMVIYKEFKTISASGDADMIERLKK